MERFGRLHPKLIDLSLGRIERLLAALGHPERRLPPVVHVAGTNGKGSVIAFLRAMLEAAGYRVHVYTSPHLMRFNERIRVAGVAIEDDALLRVLEEAESANADHPITFFEITTAAAMLAFARTHADVLLLETGLGGRLDATNVVAAPALTAITPIARDHQEFLGRGLARIAREKAGIAKPGIPLVLSRQPRAARDAIIARADAVSAPVYRNGEAWTARPLVSGFRYRGARRTLDLAPPALVGRHQIDNAAHAIACVERLDGFRVGDASITRGLKLAEWPARLQRLGQGRLARGLPPGWELWLDGGHNPAAASVLAHQARQWSDRPLFLIVGLMASKDARGFLGRLAHRARSVVAVPIAGQAGGMDPADVTAAAHAVGLAATSAADVEGALTHVGQCSPAPARVLICGSLYLAGEVLAADAQSSR